jgi:ABC-2 type transport system permease protein
MTDLPATTRAPRASSTLAALYRLLLRMQLTPLRIVGILALGAVAVLLALATRSDEDPLRATTEVAIGYGLGLVLPLATLWLATATAGDLVEDRLVVYLWLKPVPRWQLPTAATFAAVTIVVPLVAVPLVAAALVAGTSELIGPLLLASLLAVLAYAGIFVAAGLWFHRALWWGLLYILVWENGLTRAIDGAARLSIASYTQSLVADAADVSIAYADRSPTASVVVPVVVGLAGVALAVLRYRRAEID